MTTKKKTQSRNPPEAAKPKGRGMEFFIGIAGVFIVAAGVAALVLSRRNTSREGGTYAARPRGEITFNQHIAPILH